jgi:hypothetical protein
MPKAKILASLAVCAALVQPAIAQQPNDLPLKIGVLSDFSSV